MIKFHLGDNVWACWDGVALILTVETQGIISQEITLGPEELRNFIKILNKPVNRLTK